MSEEDKQVEVICISLGYVEENHVGRAIFTRVNGSGYKSRDAALDSLAKDLLEMYRDEILDSAPAPLKCCIKNKGENFCSECGRPIRGHSKFYTESFAAWICQLLNGTADNWGAFELQNWWPWTPTEAIIREFSTEAWIFLEDDWAERQLATRAKPFVPTGLRDDEFDCDDW